MLRPEWRAILAALAVALPLHGQSPQRDQPVTWGVCGHPTWPDYAGWVPANVDKQLGFVKELGCTYYRCSFEGQLYPQILDKLVPQAQAAGITILPVFPIKVVTTDDAKTNYDTNYQTGIKWAAYAIAKHYQLPYWELGNEVENSSWVSVVGDGTSPDDFPDKKPGGFVAVASALNGAYHGLQDAYAQARAKGETDVVPQMLFGCTYRHWGLVSKIGTYDHGLPFDLIAWHWYEPNCGGFNAPIHDEKSFSKGRTPAECLADFKSHTHPDQPMDVWITESNRSVHDARGWFNGSVSETGAQDWPAEAAQIKLNIADLRAAPTVKGIFIYELIDEYKMDHSDPKRLRSEGNYGLMTGLDGQKKDAFRAYQDAIRESH